MNTNKGCWNIPVDTKPGHNKASMSSPDSNCICWSLTFRLVSFFSLFHSASKQLSFITNKVLWFNCLVLKPRKWLHLWNSASPHFHISVFIPPKCKYQDRYWRRIEYSIKDNTPQYGFYIKFVPSNQQNKQINWGQPQCKLLNKVYKYKRFVSFLSLLWFYSDH